jgi:hypothetical protein
MASGDSHLGDDCHLLTMPTPMEDYVCTTCGYLETYIADQGKLNEVT